MRRPGSRTDVVAQRLLAGETMSAPQVVREYGVHKSFMRHVLESLEQDDGVEIEEIPMHGQVIGYRVLNGSEPEPEPELPLGKTVQKVASENESSQSVAKDSGQAVASEADIIKEWLIGGEWVSAREVANIGAKPQLLSVSIMQLRRRGYEFTTENRRYDGRTVKYHRVTGRSDKPTVSSSPRSSPASAPPMPALGERHEVSLVARNPDGTFVVRYSRGEDHWTYELRSYERM